MGASANTRRSHTCGELKLSNLESSVQLCGWVLRRRDHGGLVFIDLRDRYGITQIVFDPKIPNGNNAFEIASTLRSEFVLWCKGSVRNRPEGMINNKLATGEIEVACTEVVILSEAKTPPFEIDDEIDVSENLKLKYRYLDLRRPGAQKNLIIRHKAVTAAREFLNTQDFLEIETPILYKSTPEGARDFVVPSRLNPGEFYALPQSPQTLKQLLMVSGLDRYYQIARCFRDEDLRADRQPEFSQIDIETSFLNEEEFFKIIEGMVCHIWKAVLGTDLKTPFDRMSFEEAVSRFGSDKPDTRFGLELQELTPLFSKTDFKVFKSAAATGTIVCIKVEKVAENFSRKVLDDLQNHAVKHGAAGLLWIKVQENNKLQSPAAKFFSEEEKKNLQAKLNLSTGDLILLVADPSRLNGLEAMGAVRLEVGKTLNIIPALGKGTENFLWVTSFPLLEYDQRENRYKAKHHPFTAPTEECKGELIQGKNLEKIQAAAYDLVLNGVEIAGGSLRIYQENVQRAVFKALGISEDEAKEKFGFFLDALQYGTPPHGGIAFGVERLVATLCRVGPIRDVIAFPKTQKGTCLMSGSPSEVFPEQLVELGISLSKRKKP